MKKIALVIAAVVCSMSMNAQTVKLYKGETLVDSYSSSEVDKIVFEADAPAPTSGAATGTAKANINGTEKDVKWIQLWENGPKFAEFNVGATAVNELGDYFAWAETSPYYKKPLTFEASGTNIAITSEWNEGKALGYKWESYTKYTTDVYSWQNMHVFTKYVSADKAGSYGYEGFSDGLTTLEAIDDAATANWGSNWRTFTDEEMVALARNCYVEWTTDYQGLTGFIAYAAKNVNDKGIQKLASGALKILPADKKSYQNGTEENPVVLTEAYTTADTHIFIPCCGYVNGKNISGYPTTAYPSAKYMTSVQASSPTQIVYMQGNAYGISISSTDAPNYGFSVRPVLSE